MGKQESNQDKDKYKQNCDSLSKHIICVIVEGKMKKNIAFWHTIGANRKIIDIIEEGYKIPFVDTPQRAHFCNSKTAFDNASFVTESINNFIKTSSAVEMNFVPQVVGPLSVSTNSSG